MLKRKYNVVFLVGLLILTLCQCSGKDQESISDSDTIIEVIDESKVDIDGRNDDLELGVGEKTGPIGIEDEGARETPLKIEEVNEEVREETEEILEEVLEETREDISESNVETIDEEVASDFDVEELGSESLDTEEDVENSLISETFKGEYTTGNYTIKSNEDGSWTVTNIQRGEAFDYSSKEEVSTMIPGFLDSREENNYFIRLLHDEENKNQVIFDINTESFFELDYNYNRFGEGGHGTYLFELPNTVEVADFAVESLKAMYSLRLDELEGRVSEELETLLLKTGIREIDEIIGLQVNEITEHEVTVTVSLYEKEIDAESGILVQETIYLSREENRWLINDVDPMIFDKYYLAKIGKITGLDKTEITDAINHELQRYPLIAMLEGEDIFLYADRVAQKPSVLLRVGDFMQFINWIPTTPRAILPRMAVEDLNNDGSQEIICILNVGSGTGVSVDEVHVLKLNENGEYDDFVAESSQEWLENTVELVYNDETHVAIIGFGDERIEYSIPENMLKYELSSIGINGNVIRYVYDGGIKIEVPLSMSAEDMAMPLYTDLSLIGEIAFYQDEFHLKWMEVDGIKE